MYRILFAFALVLTTPAVENLINMGHVQQANEGLKALHAGQSHAFAENFNREYIFAYLKHEPAIKYPLESDQGYVRTAIAKSNDAKIDIPKMRVDGESLVVSFPDGCKIKMAPDNNTSDLFTIEGRQFKFDAPKSLHEIHSKPCILPSDSSVRQTAWLDYIFPSAEAGPLSAVKATLGALGAIHALWEAHEIIKDAQSSISSGLDRCQNRDRSEPYEGSSLSIELTHLKHTGIFNPDQEPIDCPTWVINQPLSTVLGSQLHSICKLANQLTQCVSDYKLQVRQSPSTSPGTGATH